MSAGATWRDEESGWLIRAGADTQTGNYRETNQDHVRLDPELPLAVVLDGMGGPVADHVAQLGAGAICGHVRAAHALDIKWAPEALLEAAFRAGHDAIIHWQGTDPANTNCGATAAAAWVQDDRVYVTWLGDARAYRVTGGRLERLTRDHTFVNALIRAGTITEAEARDHRISHTLLGALGRWEPELQLEFPSFVPLPGDQLVLATDGVWALLEDDTFLNTCRTISDPTTCAEALIEHALSAGSRDNCTCAVIAFERVGECPAPAPPEAPRKWWRFWK